VGRRLRCTWLSNRVFETYADIVDAACEAWNKLTARPDRDVVMLSTNFDL
jgi:hypothetical protein